MESIFKINAEIEEILETHCDPETGELSEEGEKLFDAKSIDRNTKLESTGLFVKREYMLLEALTKEKKEIEKAIKRHNRKVQSCKNILHFNLNGDKFETEKVRIGYRKSKALIYPELFNVEKFAEDYPEMVTVTTSMKPNGNEIRAELLAGTKFNVAGLRIEERNNVQVK